MGAARGPGARSEWRARHGPCWPKLELRSHFLAFSGEKYMLFASYRIDGTAVATPVWLVELDGDTLGFYTSSGSGKAKRLAHRSRVAVQPCNARGVPMQGTSAKQATARVVDGVEYEQITPKWSRSME